MDLVLSGENPTQIGWYATLHSWDALEGQFPGAHYWDGVRWLERGNQETNAGVLYWPIVFDSYQQAYDYAYEHDPDA